MHSPFDRELGDGLVRHAAIDSRNDEVSPAEPSPARQQGLPRLLATERGKIGAAEVRLTEVGAALATIPATVAGPVPGLLAQVDTAPALAASGVKPCVHRGHDGGATGFPDAPDRALSPAVSPASRRSWATTSSPPAGRRGSAPTTRPGVAIAMAAARHLPANSDIPHGRIRIAFTPDEEIGRGVDPRLPADLGAAFASPFDGAKAGEIAYENLSADAATVRIAGIAAHPGHAKGKIVNALHLAAQIVQILPQATPTPEATEGREGFPHVCAMSGTAAEAEQRLILHDVEREGLAAKGDLLARVCAALGRDRDARQRAGGDSPAVPQHARLARAGHDARGTGPRRDARRGDRAPLRADPRRRGGGGRPLHPLLRPDAGARGAHAGARPSRRGPRRRAPGALPPDPRDIWGRKKGGRLRFPRRTCPGREARHGPRGQSPLPGPGCNRGIPL
jgi:tripeptide aminopeptidase